ncbi:stage III sporulation protein AE [Ruminococcus flavefaciens]|uniref:stage III sporulation protein AE n=1 Tax=Ruminococcus flavefaciens TaxID=1265 RepID=UPI00048BDF32|nr:hypothetical protein [Ruminococcus flavefaciens]
MKRNVIIIIVTILLFVFAVPVKAFAEEDTDVQNEILTQFDDVLQEYDIDYSPEELSGISFSGLVRDIAARTSSALGAPFKLLGTILMVVVITSLLRSFGSGILGNSEKLYSMVCVITAVTVIAEPLALIFAQTLETVKICGNFIAVYIPVFSGITAACGNIGSAGIYDISLLAASELIVQLVSCMLMPVLSAVTMLSVAGGAALKSNFSGAVQLMRKLITWGLTVSMTLFTGFLNLKCTVAAKADGAASKTVRFLISGLVPVVGGAVSDAYATVRSSFDIVRGTVGAGGCMVMLLMILPPVLHILVYRAVIWAGAAASDIFGEEQMSGVLRSLDNGLAIAQTVLICYGVMFVLCTAILMQTAR